MLCIPALSPSHTSAFITVSRKPPAVAPRCFPGTLMHAVAKLPPLLFSCPDLWEDGGATAHVTGICSLRSAPAHFPSRAMPGLDVCDTLAWLALN